MRIYIAGKMRGIPYYNFPEFDRISGEFRALGWEVVNPADLDRAVGFDPLRKSYPPDYDWSAIPEDFDLTACVLRDIRELVTCDALYLMESGLRSAGAEAEVAVMRWLGRPVLYTIRSPKEAQEWVGLTDSN